MVPQYHSLGVAKSRVPNICNPNIHMVFLFPINYQGGPCKKHGQLVFFANIYISPWSHCYFSQMVQTERSTILFTSIVSCEILFFLFFVHQYPIPKAPCIHVPKFSYSYCIFSHHIIYYNGTCGNLDVDLRTYYRLFSIMVHVSKLIGCRFHG